MLTIMYLHIYRCNLGQISIGRVSPVDWIKMEKSLAMVGLMPKAKVMTGKATAPPPSEVAPATMAPKIIVTVRM